MEETLQNKNKLSDRSLNLRVAYCIYITLKKLFSADVWWLSCAACSVLVDLGQGEGVQGGHRLWCQVQHTGKFLIMHSIQFNMGWFLPFNPKLYFIIIILFTHIYIYLMSHLLEPSKDEFTPIHNNLYPCNCIHIL